jgi:hypothetical protein
VPGRSLADVDDGELARPGGGVEHGQAAPAVVAELFERTIGPGQTQRLGRGQPAAGLSFDMFGAYCDDAVTAGKRQPREQHVGEHAEHRDAERDAERQHGDGRDGEAGRLAESAAGEAQVGEQRTRGNLPYS